MVVLAGIDGGGSQTRTLLVDGEGEILGKGLAGPSNFLSVGVDKALENILMSLNQAQSTLDELPYYNQIVLGLAGVGREADYQKIWPLLKSSFEKRGKKITLTTDAHIALSGGVYGQDGVIVIAGTGAIALGQKGDKVIRAGGWGYLLDDAGSGYDLGRKAITAALRFFDGRGLETELLDLIISHFHLKEITEIIGPIYQGVIDRKEIARLTPLIVKAAQGGDRVAKGILIEAGQELAKAVLAVVKNLDLQDKFKLAGLGGILENKLPYLYPVFKEEVLKERSMAEFVEKPLEPVYGAILMAAQKEGLNVQEMIKRWREDL